MRIHDKKTVYKGLLGTAAALFVLCGQAAAEETEISSEMTAAEKEETVYVISDPEGSVEKIIVSDWLKNNDSSDTFFQILRT